MSQPRMNPYQILQLPQTASYQQIKQRYRHLSKMIHPDKQPLQNYKLAQAHFKQIDQAYKAISSSLRRYVYKHYGETGITIVQGNVFLFREFQGPGVDFSDPDVLGRLNRVMVYCLYQEHASNQIDKSVLRNKSLLMVFKPLNQINQLPSIDKYQWVYSRSEFSFQTSLPDFWGMSHTASISHQSQGLNSQTKSSMTYGLSSTKRLTETLMFTAQTQAAPQTFTLQAGLDKVINNHLVLHFIPISLTNGQLQGVQVGADLHRDSYYISGVTNFRDFTVQVGSSPLNKAVSKSVKIGVDGDAFVVAPAYERDLTARVRVFVQMHVNVGKGEKGTAKVNFGVAYGYKLKLLDQLKLQIASYISPSQSNLQLSLLTPKFKANIPIFSRSEFLKFQLYKLGIFFSIYLSFQLYNYYMRKSQRYRKKVEYENYNRLAVEKNVVAKSNGDWMLAAGEARDGEGKIGGLVVLGAWVGSAGALGRLKRRIRMEFDLSQKSHPLKQSLQKSQKISQQTPTNEDAHNNELHSITETLQAQVTGSQIFNFHIEQLRVNPCIDEKQPYYSLTLYYLRGRVQMLELGSSKPICIGGLGERYRRPWGRRVVEYFRGLLAN